MLASKSADNEIVLTRTFKARRDDLFAAMTQPVHLLQWMKTADMSFVACEVDMRVGGSFRYVFQRSSGTRIEVRGAVRAVDAPRQWAYTETYNFSPLKIEVTTLLDEAGVNTVFKQTLLYASQAELDGDYDGVATSAAEAFNNLDRYLASRRRSAH